MSEQEFREISKGFYIEPACETAFRNLGLTSIDAVFSFQGGKDLAKKNMAGFRSRLQFEIDKSPSSPTTVFLKRYNRPPVMTQLKNWLSHRARISCGYADFYPAKELLAEGIGAPQTVAFGQDHGVLFERRSFVIMEEITDAESIERELPECFGADKTAGNLKLRRDFIAGLAAFVKKFHETGFRHRDLYFSHIFHGGNGQFHLIDLARAFKPALLAERYRKKDIAQLFYSAPGACFSRTDRLRFYRVYAGCPKLQGKDKDFIRKILNRANRMARHDVKHGRTVPFADSGP